MSAEGFEWVGSEAPLSDAEVTDGNQAREAENEAGDSWRDGPAKQEVSNESYHDERHIFNGQKRRTGLRREDDHASWRDVYRACGVRGGGHE